METSTLVLLEAIRVLQIKFKALETVMEKVDPTQYGRYADIFSYLVDTDVELQELKKQLGGVGVTA
jgi:hypothetical protein